MSTNQGRSMGGHERPVRGETNDWLTPPAIIKALGPFDLDPAASLADPHRCADSAYTVAENGLTKPWNGFVWLNPPYGPEAGPFLRRLSTHGRGIALIFARTETASFFENVWRQADALFFLRGRLRFHRPDDTVPTANAGAPSVLVGYGGEAVHRLKNCALDGVFVPLGSVRFNNE